MSNVIKAAAVRYTNEKREIDYNVRAEEFVRMFVEKRALVQEQPEEVAAENEDGFQPGLAGLFAERAEAEQEIAAAGEAERTIQQAEEQAEQLRQEAEQMLADARAEAEQLLADAQKKAEKIQNQAYAQAEQKGYTDGKNKAEAELLNRKQQLEEKAQLNQMAYEKQVEELEPAFVEMVISLLKKLTGVVLEDKRAIILHLLEQALSGVEAASSYLIHVSAEDYEVVDSKKSELMWQLKENAVLEVVEDRMLRKGQCIIETDSRIFDCSIDTQLKNLTSDLKLLAGIPEIKEV